MVTTLLLVGAADGMRRHLAPALIGDGYAVESTASGETVLHLLETRTVDLIMTDLPLNLTAPPSTAAGGHTTGGHALDPDGHAMDGLDLCRRVRTAGDLPIMVVVDQADSARAIAALEAGADDCVTAPPVTAEVRARIRALLRRAAQRSSMAGGALSVGELQIRPVEGVVSRHGQDQHLTRTEFRLLCELAVAGGRVVSRKQLLRRVWGYDDHLAGSRMLDVHVRRLRRKVEADPSAPTHILTVRGVGYRVCS